MFRFTYNAVVVLLAVIALMQPAYAYLDPGTGSIILQAIIGTVAAAMVFGRSYIFQVKGWLGLNPQKISDEDERNAQQ